LVISIFSLPKYLKEKNNTFYVFLICLIVVVFAIFQSAHSKLISYIFPLFPALALLVGGFVTDITSLNQPNRQAYLALSLTLLAVFFIPVALIVTSVWFKHYLTPYVPSQLIINLFIFIFLVYGLILLFLIRRGKLRRSIYCLALLVPMMIYLIPLVRDNLEPYLSPKKACAYLLKNYNVENSILASKFFVRGVKYYTDKEVAVIDIPGTPFFSAHPIPFLNSPDKVRNFLRGQKLTYCILKNNSVQDIDGLIPGEFKSTVLKVIGNEYILKIETLPK
jgi:4-amino-4-deoxy-L-arabinose transferase-like glycosyltransferase